MGMLMGGPPAGGMGQMPYYQQPPPMRYSTTTTRQSLPDSTSQAQASTQPSSSTGLRSPLLTGITGTESPESAQAMGMNQTGLDLSPDPMKNKQTGGMGAGMGV